MIMTDQLIVINDDYIQFNNGKFCKYRFIEC